MKRLFCSCGVLKTPENTSILQEKQEFYYLCKKCSSEHNLRKRYASLSQEELKKLHEKHTTCLSLLDEYLKELRQ